MEILFRGRQFEHGQWRYGALINVDPQITYIRESKYTEGWGYQTYSVDGTTVGQYAFAEALGVKIFTGDILSEHWRAEVYQDPETGTFMVHVHDDIFSRRVKLQDYLMRRVKAGTAEIDHKIIGNIHDNPELLKVQL